jgi:hypothetical protein
MKPFRVYTVTYPLTHVQGQLLLCTTPPFGIYEQWVHVTFNCLITLTIVLLGYGLDDRGSRVRFPVGAGNFFLHHRVQNSSGAHPASCPIGTRGSYPGVKRPDNEADHWPPSRTEVKEWVKLYIRYVFIAWSLVKRRDNFTFYLYLWSSWTVFIINSRSYRNVQCTVLL